MSSNLAVATQLSPVEAFVSEVLPADRLDDLSRSLPAHIKPAMFQRNLLNAIMINPDLMSHPPGLVFREVSKAAALGLYLDPALGEAYIIESYNYKTKRIEPQLRIGYLGMTKLARQSGEVKQIYAHEVHAKDFIEAEQGAEKTLVHKPQLFTDRGPIIGYYAVVKFTNGDFDYEPMDVAQVHAIRDRSDGWKAYQDKKIKSTPWATDEGEMAKKTVIRRLTKRMPKSPELADAIRIEDDAEHSDLARTPRLVPPVPPVPQIQSTTPAIEHVPPEPPIPEPPVPKGADGAKRVADEARGEIAATTERVAPAKREAPIIGKLRAACDAAVAAKDVDALLAAWDSIVEPHITSNSLTADLYEALKSVYGEAEDAFEK